MATAASGAPPMISTYPGAAFPLPPIGVVPYGRPIDEKPPIGVRREVAPDNVSEVEEETPAHLTDFERQRIEEDANRQQNEMDVEVSDVFEGGEREELLDTPEGVPLPGHLPPLPPPEDPAKKKKKKKKKYVMDNIMS